LHPAPDATGVNGNAPFQQNFGDVLVGQRVAEVPANAQQDHFTGKWRPLNGLVEVIGMDFLRYQIPFQISQRNRLGFLHEAPLALGIGNLVGRQDF
jgi:hypothetical protein